MRCHANDESEINSEKHRNSLRERESERKIGSVWYATAKLMNRTWFVWCIGWLNFRSRFGRGTVKFIIHSYFVTMANQSSNLPFLCVVTDCGSSSVWDVYWTHIHTHRGNNNNENINNKPAWEFCLSNDGNGRKRDSYTYTLWLRFDISLVVRDDNWTHARTCTVLYLLCILVPMRWELWNFLFPPLFDFNPHAHTHTYRCQTTLST